MRKILIIICFVGVTNAYAQSPGAPTQSLTVAEANKLNGVAQPTINGIPYSQYKAQQDALKNKQQVTKSELVMPGVTLGGTENMKPIDAPQKAAITKAPPVVAKPVDVNGTSLKISPVDNTVAPEIKKEEAKPVVKSTEKGS